MYIVKDNEVIADNIFDGRNSEWFGNLQDEGWDDTYDNLPIVHGISSKAPKTSKFDMSLLREKSYYGFYHIIVKYFKDWFEKYRPDKKAGWATTYEKWKIENKGYIPEDLPISLSKDDVIEDMHFVEYENKYDCSKWLYNYLIENDIDDNADITYWFDC